ncbi:MAG: universal stress protein [Natronomonas sp.]|nr:universal stress protein [Natronomonas sp.]
MGSHGRDGPARVRFGSVAEKVARRSPVPLLNVR